MLVDLTMDMDGRTPIYPGDPRPEMAPRSTQAPKKSFVGLALDTLSSGTGGTGCSSVIDKGVVPERAGH